jgi:hypothetical protein
VEAQRPPGDHAGGGAKRLEKLEVDTQYGKNQSSRAMIICSCNVISRREIEGVIETILTDDPLAVLTPNLLYHRLGRRGKCCGCFPNVSDILVEHGTHVRALLARGERPAEASEAEEEADAA